MMIMAGYLAISQLLTGGYDVGILKRGHEFISICGNADYSLSNNGRYLVAYTASSRLSARDNANNQIFSVIDLECLEGANDCVDSGVAFESKIKFIQSLPSGEFRIFLESSDTTYVLDPEDSFLTRELLPFKEDIMAPVPLCDALDDQAQYNEVCQGDDRVYRYTDGRELGGGSLNASQFKNPHYFHSDGGGVLTSNDYSYILDGDKPIDGRPIFDSVTGDVVAFTSDRGDIVGVSARWTSILENAHGNDDLYTPISYNISVNSTLGAVVVQRQYLKTYIKQPSEYIDIATSIKRDLSHKNYSLTVKLPTRTIELCKATEKNLSTDYTFEMVSGETRPLPLHIYSNKTPQHSNKSAIVYLMGGPRTSARPIYHTTLINHLLSKTDAVIVPEYAGSISASRAVRRAPSKMGVAAFEEDITTLSAYLADAGYDDITFFYASFGGWFFSVLNDMDSPPEIQNHVLLAPWLKSRPIDNTGQSTKAFGGFSHNKSLLTWRNIFDVRENKEEFFLDKQEKLLTSCNITGKIQAYFGENDEHSRPEDLGACQSRAKIHVFDGTIHQLTGFAFRRFEDNRPE